MVAFDAVSAAASAFGTTSPLTWSHTNTGNCIIVSFAAGNGSTDQASAVTYGGQALARLGYIPSNNQTLGGMALWGLISGSLPTGANTVSVTWTTTANGAIGSSVSATVAGTFRTALTAFGNSGSATVSLPGTTSSGLVVAAAGFGSIGTLAATSPLTLRSSLANNANSGVGNCIIGTGASTGATMTPTLTCSVADWWAFVTVEILPSGGAVGILPQQAKKRMPAYFTRIVAPRRSGVYSR